MIKSSVRMICMHVELANIYECASTDPRNWTKHIKVSQFMTVRERARNLTFYCGFYDTYCGCVEPINNDIAKYKKRDETLC